MIVSCAAPVKTKNSSNCREHWRLKAKRIQGERNITAMFCGQTLRGLRGLPIVSVTFTRHSTGLLDEGDNLPNALKAVRDEVAALLGVDDGPKGGVRWLYAQTRIKRTERPSVLIAVEVDAADLTQAQMAAAATGPRTGAHHV